MSLTLPGELVWVLDLLGYNWPEADEEKLHEVAQTWRDFATTISELEYRAVTASNEVVAANSGEAIEAFTETWNEFGGGSGGHLQDAQTAALAIAFAFDAAAVAVLAGKIAVIAQLVILACEIIAAQAAAPFTLGLSEVGALGATQATRVIVRRILDEMKQAVVEAVTKAMKHATMDTIKRLLKKAVAKETLQAVADYGRKQAWDYAKQTATDMVVEGGKDAGTAAAQSLGQQGVEAYFGARDGVDVGEAVGAGKDAFTGKVKETYEAQVDAAQGLADPKTYVDAATGHAQSRAEGYAQPHVDRLTAWASGGNSAPADGSTDGGAASDAVASTDEPPASADPGEASRTPVPASADDVRSTFG
ncbi:WXG100-like domain-containing protein [Streptomyces meridianus]|uniref:PE-PGRS family protein n=1 Tax=Streptomyces meridianus TaxID=2938945 RepID=A0ABT0XDJ4_9ACTN|nr:PE-PGRS family protein [Streptomyces meridianus]MCM2579844.1 PE-PGRS family protein [Streptomyces meridianus]